MSTEQISRVFAELTRTMLKDIEVGLNQTERTADRIHDYRMHKTRGVTSERCSSDSHKLLGRESTIV